MIGNKENILILHIGSLGDTVIFTPCLRELSRRHPGAKRYLLTNINKGNKSVSPATVLAPTGLIDGTIEYPMPIRQPKDIAKLYSQINKLSPTILYYLLPEKKLSRLIRHYVFFSSLRN